MIAPTKGSPVFGAEWEVGQRRRQVGGCSDMLVCSVSLEGMGLERERGWASGGIACTVRQFRKLCAA